eukprot:CAMPEP_0114577544 /NCGR_PEP_ID=MMETSP0125-20121206/2196_1 /TAXON_ID=485358 ORGANISM="Aristerostoma sp., Strain ATCC 50986" /NCGR_SAMPLE_ID=MMETSP0125 /ASSEMBLY_ACC=CAM_ASM_000245 /LENGTH=70 /DNA_ID=CAMNT_0001766945 /DNA_START=1259 /DNA_END=1471 /DNA_ORIENTATION=+
MNKFKKAVNVVKLNPNQVAPETTKRNDEEVLVSLMDDEDMNDGSGGGQSDRKHEESKTGDKSLMSEKLKF